jgi:transcriptional regulator with XRE-family HTH domain
VKPTLDVRTRLRIAANLRLLKHRRNIESDSALAKRLGMSRGMINRILKGERTAGLDVCVAVHRTFHVSLDWLVDEDPPAEWFEPDYVPRALSR